MTRDRLIAAIGGLFIAWAAAAPPSGAAEAELGITGDVAVYRDLGACGTLTLSRPSVGVGELSAVGAVAGPGTVAAPVRGAVPFMLAGATSWYGCLPDAYAGATGGYATYQLTATTVGNDFVAVVTCVVNAGVVTCT